MVASLHDSAISMQLPVLSSTHRLSHHGNRRMRLFISLTLCLFIFLPIFRSVWTTRASSDRTLVMYAYHESNNMYVDNLRFFTEVAIEQQQSPSPDVKPPVDYIIIVNGEASVLPDLHALAKRHANVRVIQRSNHCYDGGSIGDVLSQHPDLYRGYRYFMFLNSSVRGPFLPRYFHVHPWTRAFTDLLSDTVKLVGTTISCEITVHVQSMVLAMDTTGLVLIRSAGALECPENLHAAIKNYELKASSAILDGGYNIDSFLSRYQGIDWRRHRDLHCNAAMNPHSDRMNDGLPINPFEVLFVKGKEIPRVPAIAAFLPRYTEYYMSKRKNASNIALRAKSNGYFSHDVQNELAAEWAALDLKVKNCGAIFDADFYLARNPDLVGVIAKNDLFGHFSKHGFRERRAYRYTMKENNSTITDCRFE